MERIEHHYRPYIWSPERGKYIVMASSFQRSTLEDCKKAVDERRGDTYLYCRCDWSKIQYRYQRVTYSEEIVVYE